jgi:transposase
MQCMRLNYLEIIRESEGELLALEKKHRASPYGQRFRMLRLLKSGRCGSMQQVADTLGFSLRQCQRWLDLYRRDGLDRLTSGQWVKRGGVERMTPAAWKALNEALAGDEISSYTQARALLAEHGVFYKDESSIFKLFKRHRIKAKTGRYQHQKADPEAQEAFKKTSPPTF